MARMQGLILQYEGGRDGAASIAVDEPNARERRGLFDPDDGVLVFGDAEGVVRG